MNPARHHVPHVRPFDLGAHPYATRAENAAVMVEHEAGMAGVDLKLGKVVRKAHAGHAQRVGNVLQFAMAIGDANRAHVITLDQQQFGGDAAVAGQLRRSGRDRHSILHRRCACRKQAVDAGNFHHAQPARSHRTQPFEVTQRRNVLPARARRFQNGLSFQRIDQLAVDAKRNFFLRQLNFPFWSSKPRRTKVRAARGPSIVVYRPLATNH